jgi:hypothetical protein
MACLGTFVKSGIFALVGMTAPGGFFRPEALDLWARFLLRGTESCAFNSDTSNLKGKRQCQDAPPF